MTSSIKRTKKTRAAGVGRGNRAKGNYLVAHFPDAPDLPPVPLLDASKIKDRKLAAEVRVAQARYARALKHRLADHLLLSTVEQLADELKVSDEFVRAVRKRIRARVLRRQKANSRKRAKRRG